MKILTLLTKRFCNISLILFFLSLSSALFSQNIGINVSGATPSKNAILDLNTGNPKNLGLLVPRVVLGASLSTFSPPLANAPTGLDSGMMVFNWQATNQPIGYYFWNGGLTGTWTSIGSGSSGVTSVTGVAPIFSSGGSTPAISLQGTAGTVFYGTGAGSNFTAVGNAPAGTPTSASSNYLQSQGAAAPAWVQPVSRYVFPVQREAVACAINTDYFPVPGATFSSNGNSFVIPAGGLHCFYADATISSTGNFSKAYGSVADQTAGVTVTFYVYKYTFVNNSAAAITGTLIGQTSVNCTTATADYLWEIDANTALNKGDFLTIWWSVSAASNVYWSGTLETTTNVQ
jgi:hypothetical protein